MKLRDFFYPKKDLTRERRKNLDVFCRNLNLHFKDYSILDLAFHHRSFSNENISHKKYNNERLEFLKKLFHRFLLFPYVYIRNIKFFLFVLILTPQVFW